jgi:hypothetical protein
VSNQFAGPPIEHLELEVSREHDLRAAVGVQIVNLERRVVREKPVPGIWPSLLPEHLAVERHRGEATDLIERIAAHLCDVLRKQHVERAIAIEIAEADISASAKAGRLELPPYDGAWVFGAQSGELGLSTLRTSAEVCSGRCRRRHAERPKARRSVRGHASNARRQFLVAHVDERFAIYRRPQPVALDVDFESVPRLRVVRKRHAGQFSPVRGSELLVDWQPHRQPQTRAVLERKPVVMPRRPISNNQPGLLLQQQRPHRDFDTIIAPLRIARDEKRLDALWFEVDGVLLEVRTLRLVAPSPGVEMDDRIPPGMRAYAAMLDVVILLDRAVEQPQRRGEHPGRKPREVISEELDVRSSARPNASGRRWRGKAERQCRNDENSDPHVHFPHVVVCPPVVPVKQR